MQELDPLMREALAWVVRLRSGEVTVADLDDLKLWRGRSPAHEEAFQEAALLWRDLKRAADQETASAPGRAAGWKPTRRLVLGGAIAASTAAYLAYKPPLDMWPSLGELAADYRTAKGERREVAPVAGVSVTLNTQTSLSVEAGTGGAPQLQLVSGEAAVSADRPADAPLVVVATQARITAAKARFNARCIAGEVSVACLEGDVQVDYGGRSVHLTAGHAVDASPTSGLGTAQTAAAGEVAAWREGLLIIRDQPLADAVEEVNRYRPGRLIVTNEALRRRKINGTFHVDRLDDFIGQVRLLFGARVRELPGGVVLFS